MKYIITDEQVKTMESVINGIIDGELCSIRTQSEDWGLGEMDEIDEINSVEKITVDRIDFDNGIKVYVNVFVNTDREDFYNVMSSVEYEVSNWIPGAELEINEIKQI
jgi:hypothetical protein